VKTANGLDYVVVVIYLAMILAIGVVFMRLNRGGSDYFRGGNRIPWLVASLSAFMSGFSAFTFTGMAGIAYKDGLIAIATYIGNASTFLLGYWVFASRWRRARISSTMEYLSERFDDRSRRLFSVTTVFFQIFMGASMLFGVGLFVASVSGLSPVWTTTVAGTIVLVYCMLGGLWAVVVADFLQAVILMPFALILFTTALIKTGGLANMIDRLPANMTSLSLPGYGWIYVVAWTLMVSVGYNTAAQAQRYFSVDNESSARKAALLCSALFFVGSLIWFVPPMAMRVLYPDVSAVWPGWRHPEEAAYALASMTLLPNGLIGIMLAAIFSATITSISGLLNLHSAIISKDIYQAAFAPHADEKRLLRVGRIATVAVGAAITLLATELAVTGRSVFQVMVTFNTIISLAYGPPALLGLVVKRTPHWSGLLTFSVSLVLGCLGSFIFEWGLVTNVLTLVPVSVLVFLGTRLFEGGDQAHAAARDALFDRLNRPVDVASELRDSVDPTRKVFRFLSLTTAAIGILTLLFLFSVPAGERVTVVSYSVLTLAVAGLLSLVRGTSAKSGSRTGEENLPGSAGIVPARGDATVDPANASRQDACAPRETGKNN